MAVDSAFLWQFKALQPGNEAQRNKDVNEDDVQTAGEKHRQ